MLEVIGWDPEKREAIVMSGFGPDASWRLNVLAGGAVEVQIAGLRFEPRVRSPEREEASGVLADYERRNRLAGLLVRWVLSRLAGFRYDGSSESRSKLVEALPLLALSPRRGGEPQRPGEARAALDRHRTASRQFRLDRLWAP
jgi:hypothetical protein